jgi:SOS response regulatory protein OraA/RecX
MAELGGPHDQLDRARHALRGRTAADRKERDKLVRRLVTRGFDLSIAIRAVDAGSSPVEDA